MGARQFGARVPRVEDPALLTGRARFVDDVKLPGTLHAAFVRSPHAHARLIAIRTEKAAALPGVKAIITGADPSMLLTTARRADGHNAGDFVIDGTKWLITGAVGADLAIIMAKTESDALGPAGATIGRYSALAHRS